MSSLWSKTKNAQLFDQLTIAESSASRMRGLLGRTNLPESEAILIKGETFIPANFVHTLFMKFPIDLIFIDREIRVVALKENVKPWRVCWPVLRAHSVIETAAGAIGRHHIAVGDQLDVVS